MGNLFELTDCDLVEFYGKIVWIKSGSDNGLVFDSRYLSLYHLQITDLKLQPHPQWA